MGRRAPARAGSSSSTRSTREDVDLPARAGRDPRRLRQGVPADQPAGRRRASASSTASSTRRARPISRRSSDAHRALVDQVVEVDEELMSLYLEQGDVDAAATARAARAGAAGRPPDAGVLRLGAHRRRRRRTARRHRQARCPIRPKATRRCSSRARATAPPIHSDARSGQARARARLQGRVDPFVGKLGVFRVHQGTVTRDTQLYVGDGRKPFKVGHLFMLQGRQARRDRPRGAGRHLRRRQGRRDRSSTRCCTTRTTRTTSTCTRSNSRCRCTAWRSARSAAATSSASPTCCTSWSPRTRA